jgi:hypothetical protein
VAESLREVVSARCQEDAFISVLTDKVVDKVDLAIALPYKWWRLLRLG